MDPLDLGSVYAEIGALALDAASPAADGMLVYVEVSQGMIFTSVFTNKGDRVVYHDSTQELTGHIYKTWLSIEPGKRWATMTYTVDDGRFHTSFRYPDEVDVEDMSDERRQEAVKARFGNKPVHYPQD
jgi:hypothetical protein